MAGGLIRGVGWEKMAAVLKLFSPLTFVFEILRQVLAMVAPPTAADGNRVSPAEQLCSLFFCCYSAVFFCCRVLTFLRALPVRFFFVVFGARRRISRRRVKSESAGEKVFFLRLFFVLFLVLLVLFFFLAFRAYQVDGDRRSIESEPTGNAGHKEYRSKTISTESATFVKSFFLGFGFRFGGWSVS